MSVVIRVSEGIDRPVAEVFRIHAREHVRNHPRWDPQMQLEQVTQGPIGVGTIIKRMNTHGGSLVIAKHRENCRPTTRRPTLGASLRRTSGQAACTRPAPGPMRGTSELAPGLPRLLRGSFGCARGR